ncbi:venom dipeptidyl peptidase 4 [Glossina fuscipes]|uniref:Venom dipeptidyl peptidase 4 n=1 Tax=Glossina fuscipes TaxID=7396 RepID=A0A8U0WCW8_9MUSC|nr:venom dipeptidyl peptidase 4 [Glossina fuscipes]
MHLLIALLLCCTLWGQVVIVKCGPLQTLSADSGNGEDKKPWDLNEAIFATSKIRSFNGTWISDKEFYYGASDRSLHIYDVVAGTDEIFVPSKILEKYGKGSSAILSPSGTRLLIRFNVEHIFRHSSVARYDIYDLNTGLSTEMHNGKKLQYCIWHPHNDDHLAYVYNNNVFVHRVGTGEEIPLTSDGKNGVIYNGIPDWVYEEEVLSNSNALWWSPDGSKLLVGWFNDTDVETYKYFIYGEANDPEDQYPTEVDLKYPKSGTNNPLVAVRLFDISSLAPSMVLITAPTDVVGKDHILQNVKWTNNDKFIVTWLNRRQNIASIQACSAEGVCKEVKRLSEPAGWISMTNLLCLKSGERCLFSNWIDNWYQVWNLNLQNGDNLWTSRGNFTVLNIYGYDEDKDKLYYQATMPYDPSIYHVFSNEDCLTCSLRDSEGDLCRSATASFSKNFTYFMATCAGPNPSYSKIVRTETKNVAADWELNTEFREKLSTKLRPTIKYMNVTLADGSRGIARLSLPPNLDEKKKYPLIVWVYGGPNSVRVTNSFTVGFEAYLTTKRQVIYAQIDGRGTGNKGKALLHSINNHLGEFEVADQIYVTKYLQQELPYVDAENTGIWGWSYGGYLTARTLGNDTHGVYKCGVSVAPVTSWLYYDSIYTERYMGLPTPEDNLRKYMETDVFDNVENFRHHDFLLIHGSADDNVHYQNSLMLAKVLQQHQIIFDEMTYTDENHSIGSFLPHLYQTMDRFWSSCLNLEVFEEYEN